MRGSPASSGSARQFDTPGYGCDTGPGYQRSVIATGNDVAERHEPAGQLGRALGHVAPGVERLVRDQPRAVLGLRVLAVVNSSRSCTEW